MSIIQQKDRFYNFESSPIYYKIYLQTSDGVQDGNGTNLSRYSFQLNSSFDNFKGLCRIFIENIILEQYTGIDTGGNIYVRLDDTQPFSSSSDKNMNNSNILFIIPITSNNQPTTYYFDNSASEIITNMDSRFTISLTDKNGANLLSNSFTDLHLVLRIYPMK